MEEIIVEIPGVGEVAFPASMGNDAISAAAKKLYDESQQQTQQQPVQTHTRTASHATTTIDLYGQANANPFA